MKTLLRTTFAIILLSSVVFSQEKINYLFKEVKVKNYLPHMTWEDVEEALKRTDMVIIPVGSIEQHGKHLPLCTDLYASVEICKLIAQRTDVIVSPAVFAGISEHHMGFPGTITLSPSTFEAVVFETAQSLIRHGFRKILIYNGHGGNKTSVQNVIHKINHNTPATAVELSGIVVPEEKNTQEKPIPYDWHGGVNETSLMLYLTNSLVDMSKAEKPILTFPPEVERMMKHIDEEPNLQRVTSAKLFLPERVGKKASTRELSNTGIVTSGNPKDATVERGRKRVERFVESAVKFIEMWKKLE
ncbi:hypothetical protein DRQ09_05405 [candidate division KSB1 bacterium]|nr:MAG: hypothetical protein DRQ09_05405 [candidate division KSB1 bacterium]